MEILRRAPTAAIYSLDDPNSACPSIRIFGPLRNQNWTFHWGVRTENGVMKCDTSKGANADIIIISRNFPSKFTESALLELIALNKPILYDLDDAFLNPPKNHPRLKFISSLRVYIQWMLQEADLITVSTEPLAASLINHTSRPVRILHNLVDYELFYAPPPQRGESLRVLISGTTTHRSDWSIIERPLQTILERYPGRVTPIFFGDIPDAFRLNPHVEVVEFKNSYHEYALTLKSLNAHVALVPLEQNIFNQCKSNIKWLEYSAAGIAGIFSNITPYSKTIRDGITGFLADADAPSWVNAIEHLIANPPLIKEIARSAQNEVRAGHSIQFAAHNYQQEFNEFARSSRRDSLTLRGHLARRSAQLRQCRIRCHHIFQRYIGWRFENHE